MDCIVHGFTKSWTRLSDFHWALKLLRISKQQQQSFKANMGPSKLGALCKAMKLVPSVMMEPLNMVATGHMWPLSCNIANATVELNF